MNKGLENLVAAKRLHQKIAQKISTLAADDQAQLLNFISDFRLGVNYSQEYIGYLLDIARRDRFALSAILNDQAIADLKAHAKLSHADRLKRLREILRDKRFGTSIKADSFTVCQAVIPKKKIDQKRQKGSWLKRCPGTLKHICCNYLVINSISGCPYACTYCFLDSYLRQPGISVFNNHDDLMEELKEFFFSNKATHYRLGTGEFSDSLALDKETGLSQKLIELFAGQDDHLLELKTKSVEVDHLLSLEHRGKAVFAWSVNPQRVVESEELGTVSLKGRLAGARKCVAAGFPVAFHFDPIIYYDGWESDYKQVVDEIMSGIDPKSIAWISLGALRYQPELKDILEQKYPHSRITLGQLDIGEDNKIRYLKTIRLEIFQKMNSWLRAHSNEVFLYLCMESPEIWREVGIINHQDNLYAKYFRFFHK